MKTNEIRTAIKTVYGMLWEILAMYEKTDCYNRIPEDEEGDIWEYLGEKLLETRKEIDTLFLGEAEIRQKLYLIVDETEQFVRSYEMPGVVKRWRSINPHMLFFDAAFEMMEDDPELYKMISRGLTDVKFACYPDEEMIAERKQYFADEKQKIKDGNLRYSEERVFQNELLRTLTLVFENDFKEYL